MAKNDDELTAAQRRIAELEHQLEAQNAVPSGTAGAVDGPHSHAIRAAMAEKGVETVSELHELYGKAITYDGLSAVIDYAIGDRFRCTTEPAEVQISSRDPVTRQWVTRTIMDNRQPYGLIADIVTAADGSLSYTTPEGA